MAIRFAQVDQHEPEEPALELVVEDCVADIRPPLGWSKSDVSRYGAYREAWASRIREST